MAFDPRSAKIRDGHYPWDADPDAVEGEAMRVADVMDDAQKGPQERSRIGFSFDVGEFWETVAGWARRLRG